jgi:hypothetical protein
LFTQPLFNVWRRSRQQNAVSVKLRIHANGTGVFNVVVYICDPHAERLGNVLTAIPTAHQFCHGLVYWVSHLGLTFGNGDTLGADVPTQWTPCTSIPCALNTSRSVLMLSLQASYEGNISAVSGGLPSNGPPSDRAMIVHVEMLILFLL